MEIITILSFYLPSKKRTLVYVVYPIWDTSTGRVASSIILKIDLQYYMPSSMHHIKIHHVNHVTIMCVQITYTTCDV